MLQPLVWILVRVEIGVSAKRTSIFSPNTIYKNLKVFGFWPLLKNMMIINDASRVVSKGKSK